MQTVSAEFRNVLWRLSFGGTPRAELPRDKVAALLGALRILAKPRTVPRQVL